MRCTVFMGLVVWTLMAWTVSCVAEECEGKGIPMEGAEECTKLNVEELRNGDLEAIKARVASSADVNCPIPNVFNSAWSKPLALAVQWLPRLVMEYLVSQGAAIEGVRKRYDYEENALEILVWWQDEARTYEIAEFLLGQLDKPSQETLGRAFVAAAE